MAGLGIHNNSSCIRCGACCVCFSINSPELNKHPHEVCEHLSYEGTRAGCDIYSNGRPSDCKGFFCGNLQNEEERRGLAITAQKMIGSFET